MSIADKLRQIAENEQRVYEAGYTKGKSEGGDSYYDEFWDIYQQNGTREHYGFAFAGHGWTINNFKPKYDIIVKGSAYSMFANCENLKKTDLEQLLTDLGITLDTSGVTSIDGFEFFCKYSSPPILPVISTVNTPRLINMFYNCPYLMSIRKLILKEDGSQTLSNLFPGCQNLKNLIVEGVIGQNGFDVKGSPKLSHDSIVSIINALSTTTSGLTVTLSKEAVNNAFETAEGLADGLTSSEWLNLIATKQNWTISLV